MEIRKAITLRFGIVYFAIALFGLVIIGRILIIQNVDTEKWKVIAKDLKSNTTEIWAKRGNICADDGSILSTSVPYYELRLDMQAPRVKEVFARDSEMFVEEMSNFFGFSKADFRTRLKAAYDKKNRWFLINPQQIDHNKFQEFRLLKSISRTHFGSGLIVACGESLNSASSDVKSSAETKEIVLLDSFITPEIENPGKLNSSIAQAALFVISARIVYSCTCFI